ncbi:MAG: hypothetical protein Q9160_001056 [Pyrenula sp. 1 TL-2023]
MSKRTGPIPTEPLSLDTLEEALANDTKVKVAGIDVDGILRGKLISKKKFLSIAKDGFGFCSVIFGWDMHDKTYLRELKVSTAENGYRDMVAIPDLKSFRRIPWENDVPFFLVNFHNPDGEGQPICACPRGLLRTVMSSVEDAGYSAMAGDRFTIRNITTAFLIHAKNSNAILKGGTQRAGQVFTKLWVGSAFMLIRSNEEQALEFGEIKEMADRANLFKFVLTKPLHSGSWD